MEHRRALAGLALAATVFTAAALVYRHARELYVDFERGYEGAFVESFHPRERDESGYFRWTRPVSFVVFHQFPTTGTVEVELRIRTRRPPGMALPSLGFTANGVTVQRAQALPGTRSYRFEFPSTSSRLALGIESDTFEEGDLGVQVLGVRAMLERPPSWLPAAAWFALAALLLLAAGVVSGLSPQVASAGALLLSLASVHLSTFEAVRFTSYPKDVALLSAAVLGVTALLRFFFDRAGWLHRSERASATALLALLLFVKLFQLSYPLMLSSDADFQANRMREVLSGNFYPTSVTQHQPPFSFPYPVSLYVMAAPLALLGVDVVAALETVTAVFDVLVSGLLLFLARRYVDDFRAGAIAAVLYQLVPMNASAFSAGNFTNLFAVSMLAASFALVSISASSGSMGAIAAAAVTTVLAITAHFGMLLEAVVLWPLWLGLLFLCPAPVRDRRGLLALALLGSFLLAGSYYLGYLDLVTSQWGRAMSSGAGVPAGVSLGLVVEQVGAVFLLTSLLGSVSFLRKPFQHALSATATGWLLVTAFFFGLDRLTAIEIRYWLQALPLLALFAGVYLSRASNRGVVGKTTALAATGYFAFVGLRTLYQTLLFQYH